MGSSVERELTMTVTTSTSTRTFMSSVISRSTSNLNNQCLNSYYWYNNHQNNQELNTVIRLFDVRHILKRIFLYFSRPILT